MPARTHKPRRIVTRLDEQGQSRIACDEELSEIDYDAADPGIEQFYPGWSQGLHPEIRIVWGTENLPFRNPEQQDAPPSPQGLMAVGRPFVRMSHITYPAGWEGLPFWSETTDVIWLISGELTFITDSGEEATLKAGDTLVQNATNKSIHNRGAVPAVMAAVMCASERVGPSPPRCQCVNRS